MERVHQVVAEAPTLSTSGELPAAPGQDVDVPGNHRGATAGFIAAVRAAYPDIW